jgi:hypothetical protein
MTSRSDDFLGTQQYSQKGPDPLHASFQHSPLNRPIGHLLPRRGEGTGLRELGCAGFSSPAARANRLCHFPVSLRITTEVAAIANAAVMNVAVP